MNKLHIDRKQLLKQKGNIEVGEMSDFTLDETQTSQLGELLAMILTDKGEHDETSNQ